MLPEIAVKVARRLFSDSEMTLLWTPVSRPRCEEHCTGAGPILRGADSAQGC